MKDVVIGGSPKIHGFSQLEVKTNTETSYSDEFCIQKGCERIRENERGKNLRKKLRNVTRDLNAVYCYTAHVYAIIIFVSFTHTRFIVFRGRY